MEIEMFFWILIVGISIIGVLGYFIYTVDKPHSKNFHYIDIDHDDIYCDDDDCEE